MGAWKHHLAVRLRKSDTERTRSASRPTTLRGAEHRARIGTAHEHGHDQHGCDRSQQQPDDGRGPPSSFASRAHGLSGEGRGRDVSSFRVVLSQSRVLGGSPR